MQKKSCTAYHYIVKLVSANTCYSAVFQIFDVSETLLPNTLVVKQSVCERARTKRNF